MTLISDPPYLTNEDLEKRDHIRQELIRYIPKDKIDEAIDHTVYQFEIIGEDVRQFDFLEDYTINLQTMRPETIFKWQKRVS